ncbi:MAG: hypothetical protein IT200_16105 [Thermoleophilia bacterium]|nr:hypothetical protein [Thermoleophilia bacterium]
MIALRAIFHFRMQGLWVTNGVLGQIRWIDYEELRVCVVFPPGPEGYPEGIGVDDPQEIRYLPASEAALGPPYLGATLEDATCLSVYKLRIVVTGKEVDEGTAISYRDDGREGFYRRARRVAQKIAAELVDQIRPVQTWIGRTEEPPPLTEEMWLEDATTGRRICGPMVELIQHTPLESWAAAPEHVNHALDQVATGVRPPLPFRLIADAYYLGAAEPARDLRHALLLAGVALEVQAQQVIGTRLPRRGRMATRSLLDKGMREVFGQSLAETDPRLAEKTRAVIDFRNAVAHGEEELPQAGVRPGEALKAAYDVIVLLQELHQTARRPSGDPDVLRS